MSSRWRESNAGLFCRLSHPSPRVPRKNIGTVSEGQTPALKERSGTLSNLLAHYVRQKLLLTLAKCRDGVSWRRLAGWHNKIPASSVYQTLNRMKRAGLVSKGGLITKGRFYITEKGRNVLKQKLKGGDSHNRESRSCIHQTLGAYRARKNNE